MRVLTVFAHPKPGSLNHAILERFTALNRKLELVSRTVETALGILQHRRSLRVEWYIVLLIVFEIGLTLYQLFWIGSH